MPGLLQEKALFVSVAGIVHAVQLPRWRLSSITIGRSQQFCQKRLVACSRRILLTLKMHYYCSRASASTSTLHGGCISQPWLDQPLLFPCEPARPRPFPAVFRPAHYEMTLTASNRPTVTDLSRSETHMPEKHEVSTRSLGSVPMVPPGAMPLESSLDARSSSISDRRGERRPSQRCGVFPCLLLLHCGCFDKTSRRLEPFTARYVPDTKPKLARITIPLRTGPCRPRIDLRAHDFARGYCPSLYFPSL
jgi:hypothetical protein